MKGPRGPRLLTQEVPGRQRPGSGLGLPRDSTGLTAWAGKRLTLPEGEKNDGLDHEELEDGAVGAKQVPGGKVEEEEGIEGQADGDVVDDGHVEVAAGDTVGVGSVLWLGQSLPRDSRPPSRLCPASMPSPMALQCSPSSAPRATEERDLSGQEAGVEGGCARLCQR